MVKGYDRRYGIGVKVFRTTWGAKLHIGKLLRERKYMDRKAHPSWPRPCLIQVENIKQYKRIRVSWSEFDKSTIDESGFGLFKKPR